MSKTKKELKAKISYLKSTIGNVRYQMEVLIHTIKSYDLRYDFMKNDFKEREVVYKTQVEGLQKELSSLQHDFDEHRALILQNYEARDKKIAKLNQDIDMWTERFNEAINQKNLFAEESRELQRKIDELETQAMLKDNQYASLQVRFENVLGKQMSDRAAEKKPIFETLGDVLMPAAVDNPVMERQQESPEYGSEEWLHGKIDPPIKKNLIKEWNGKTTGEATG